MSHHLQYQLARAEQEERLRRGSSPGQPVSRTDARQMRRVVANAASGDAPAWAALVDRFAARVRATARRHRLAPHDVDDVLQTTWLRLFEHIDDVRDPNSLGAWLETTARRESLRLLRAAGRERPTDPATMPEEATEATVERELLMVERQSALARAVDRLPSSQRTLLRTLLTEPVVSYAEVSRSLGLPIGSIGPTRARSLARLRQDGELMQLLAAEDAPARRAA